MNIYQSPEWAAHLAVICESPNDDLPRMVAADWLDEHGDRERGEFIRIMVAEQARGKFGLTDRVRELVRDEWCEPLAAMHHASRAGEWKIGWKWSRGFVSEVRMSLAGWLGASCETCAGSGVYYLNPIQSRGCLTCHGTGRTLAHGPRIVREHPVDRVVLTDREPDQKTHDWFSWGNDRGTSGHPRNLLTPVIWGMLEPLPGRSYWTTGFATAELAHTALSSACLAWANSQPAADPTEKSPKKRGAESILPTLA